MALVVEGLAIQQYFQNNLPNDHIISWSNEGDLVYDPFMGSGTTAKMAILNKRKWIGSEISEEYCKIIERRITTASMVSALMASAMRPAPIGDDQDHIGE